MARHRPNCSGYYTGSLRERGSICTSPQVNKLPIYLRQRHIPWVIDLANLERRYLDGA